MGYDIERRRARKITNDLLTWYDDNKRDLPWRHTRAPYHIWVSEIMAQQTRISFLLAYYERFIQRFPTIHALSLADEAEVLKAWEGLGYYSRAINLQKAAKAVVSNFNGRLPKTKEELLTLPGIGEYTAGAILSIAYDIPTPAVDGNVLRVFSRLECSELDIRLTDTKQIAAEFVLSIMPADSASRFTQSLMELGALVCRPQNPNCFECPVTACCKACRSGRQSVLPNKSPKAASRVQNKTIVVLRNARGEILMRKRTEKLLSGLWEFYMAEGNLTQPEVRAELKSLGHPSVTVKDIGASRHAFTHVVWQMHGYDCQSGADCLPEGYQWIDEAGVKTLALPTALRFYTKKAFPTYSIKEDGASSF